MVEGLPAGTHGYHVHMYGDCSSDDGTSAGPHLNFHGPSHHDASPHPTEGTATTARPGVATAPGASGVQAQPGTVDRTPGTMIHGNLGEGLLQYQFAFMNGVVDGVLGEQVRRLGALVDGAPR